MPPVHPQTQQVPQQKFIRDTYTYSVNVASLASGASVQVPINIKADADFAWQKSMQQCDLAAAALTWSGRIIPLVTVLMTDGGSGRQLMDQALPVGSLFGLGDLPFILPQPKIFTANSTIVFTLTNYSAATTYTNMYLSLHGTLLFPIKG